MKKLLLSIGIILASLTSVRAQDYMDEITQKSCECIENIKPNVNKDLIAGKLGLCMIQASLPYKKELKKEHKVDLDKMNEKEGHKLGTIIGLRLAGVCPESLLKMTNLMNEGKVDEIIIEELDEEEFKSDSKQTKGKIINIEKDLFVVFNIEETNGKTSKFIWLNFVQSNIDLPEQWESLKGKEVSVLYTRDAQFFDPKINDYRIFLILEKLTVE